MAPLPGRFLILDDESGTQPARIERARGGQVRHGTPARREIRYLERQ
jgi:hypothetical protein